MSTTVLELMGKIGLDSSSFESGLGKARGSMSSFGSTVGKAALAVGTTIATGLAVATGATVAFAKSSVQTGMSFDKAMSQVAATMGGTMADMENEIGTTTTAFGTFTGNLREFAMFLGRNTAFSATQAAEALNYTALAGYNAQESMDMLPTILALAAAGNMDLARASDMVTDTQTAFGFSMERTAQMVDEMAKAASTGNTSVAQMGDAFLVVGGLAQELNGGFVTLADGTQAPVDGIQELEIALTAMANAGIKGSEAGTHVRNMILKLAKPTDDGAAALEDMGVAIFDVDGNMRSLVDIFGDLNAAMTSMTQEEKMTAIGDLFNTRDLASAEAILNAISSDWDEIGEAILDSEGAAQRMADTQLDNLAGDITLFKSALEGAQIVISDSLTPELRNLVQFGTDAVSRLTEAFQSGGVSGAMAEMGNIISEGIGLIIGDLPDIVDAGIDLVSGIVEGITDNIDVLADGAQQIVSMLGTFIAEKGPEIASGATALIIALVGALLDPGLLSELLDAAVAIVVNLASSIATAAPELIPAAITAVLTLIDGLLANIDLLIDAGIQLLLGVMSGIEQALPIIAAAIPGIIGKLQSAFIQNAPALISAGIQLIASLESGIIQMWGAFLTNLPQYIEELIDAFGNVDLSDVGAQIINTLWDGVLSVWGSFKSWFLSAFSGILNVIADIGEFMGKDVAPIRDAITEMDSDELSRNNLVSTVEKGVARTAGDSSGYAEWNKNAHAIITQNIYAERHTPSQVQKAAAQAFSDELFQKNLYAPAR